MSRQSSSFESEKCVECTCNRTFYGRGISMVLSGDGMRCDTADVKRVELSAHTQMSEMESVLSVRELISRLPIGDGRQ